MIPSFLGGMTGFLLLLSWGTFQIVAGIFPAFMQGIKFKLLYRL